jgi:hypothetical protein
MADSGVRLSWASTIVGDVSSPSKLQQRLEEVTNQVTISLPPFNGRYNPGLYIDWECEINAIFDSHNFTEHKKVKTAISKFTDLASIWWNGYCRVNFNCLPTTWVDLKLAMRHRFVPSYYTRDMVKKLHNLHQGSDTVREYYVALETTLLHSFLEESEHDFMDRFWEGLNHNIQDIIMHVKFYSIEQMFRLACKAEQKIQSVPTTSKSPVETPSLLSKKDIFSTVQPSAIMIPTSCEQDVEGNKRGIENVPPHDKCHVDLNLSFGELAADLVTPSLLHLVWRHRIGSGIGNCRIRTRILAFGEAWNLGPEFGPNSCAGSRIPSIAWLVSDPRASEITWKRSGALASSSCDSLWSLETSRRRPTQSHR